MLQLALSAAAVLLLQQLLPGTAAAALSYADVRGVPYEVSSTPRGLRIANRSTLLLSGDVHYARALPEEQDAALDRLAADSLNTVQTYVSPPGKPTHLTAASTFGIASHFRFRCVALVFQVFWSLHEPDQGAFCWGDGDASSSASCAAAGSRANITRFLAAAADRGLFVILRVGPFICGEWSYGGIPAWINDEPAIQIRAHNPRWEASSKRARDSLPRSSKSVFFVHFQGSHSESWVFSVTAFVRAVWPLVEPFTAKHGGPIVLLQLENEDGRADPSDPYVQYVAGLAESLNASLPFLWCEGGEAEIVPFNGAPAIFVPAVNGNDGADYAESQTLASPQYPLFWTENEGWYHPWGSAPIDGGAGLRGTVPPPARPPSWTTPNQHTSLGVLYELVCCL